jgi:RimJ/RimL family protein N-acetyltransferase
VSDVRWLVPPDPPLTNGRVTLRQFRPDDAAAVARSCRDDDIPRFTFMPEGLTVVQAAGWIEDGLREWPDGVARFAIAVADEERPVGQVGVAFEWAFRRAEAFYWVDRGWRRQGIASGALELATVWALDRAEIVRVHLLTHTDNVASHGVARRCGFEREGVLRRWEPVKDDQPDVVMWSRLAPESD